MKNIHTGLDMNGNVIERSPSTNQVTVFKGTEDELLAQEFKPLIWVNPDEENEDTGKIEVTISDTEPDEKTPIWINTLDNEDDIDLSELKEVTVSDIEPEDKTLIWIDTSDEDDIDLSELKEVTISNIEPDDKTLIWINPDENDIDLSGLKEVTISNTEPEDKTLIWINPDDDDDNDDESTGAKTYTTHVQGNGTDNFINIEHNLNTTDIAITIIDQNNELCLFDIEIIDENSLKLKARKPIPATDEFDITIIG